MATSAVASPFALYQQSATSGQSSYPLSDSDASNVYDVDRLSLHTHPRESIEPFPPKAGPEAGASAVIDAENHGLLSVAAVGALVAGVTALVIPMLYEASGARVKNRKDKYLLANEARDDEASLRMGSEVSRIFKTLDHDYQKDVERSVSDLGDHDVHQALRKLSREHAPSATPVAKLDANELFTLRRGILLTLMQHAHERNDHELLRVLVREHAIFDRLGPGDPGSKQLRGHGIAATDEAFAKHHAQRQLFRSSEMHLHDRFLGFIDGLASFASAFSRLHRVPGNKTLFNPAIASRHLPVVQRPRTTADVHAFYGSLERRPEPWVRALHSAKYIDQRWPGLLGEAAHARTTSNDRFEVWVEHPIPKKRATTDLPIPESKTRVVAVFAHKPENDAALAKVDYSLGRELDVAHGNYAAFKSGPTVAKLRQIKHRYSLYLHGAKETMANPKGMGMVLANLGITSITLSALLYGMLYLVEYGKIEQDLKKHGVSTATPPNA